MALSIRVERKSWGFEVWGRWTDDKGKETRVMQIGSASHGPTPEDFRAAMSLMDPFAPGRWKE
jgi:hypothetical protein